jgi:type IV secretory pathway VirJ component
VNRRTIIRASTLVWLTAALLCTPLAAQDRLAHGRFKEVAIYRPAGEVKQFVLFLSGDSGWSPEVADIARKLVERGAMVAGIDTPKLFAALEADGAACVFPDGDLENLSHYVQGYARLPTYHTPLLVGYSSGASMAYAMLAQAPSGTFAGALSLGFCADLDLAKPLCRGEGVHFTRRADGKGVDLLPSKALPVNWVAFHGARDQACPTVAARGFVAQIPRAQFVELPEIAHAYPVSGDWLPRFLVAYDGLAARAAAALPPPPASLADLPLVEVRAKQPGTWFAVLLSGDGGWAGLDKNVAAALAAKGVDVVGVDSLRYFWSKRTPQGLADDLDRIVRYYAAQWKKTGALLVGYSQGADVLPFAMNRLPTATRSLVRYSVLMGLGRDASFEFHVGNWLGGDDDEALPIRPEAAKLDPQRTLCIYGADEKDSLCPQLAPASVEALRMPGGHHFDGAYDALAATILEHAARIR